MPRGDKSDGNLLSEILAQSIGLLVVIGLAIAIGGLIGVVVFVGYFLVIIFRALRLEMARDHPGKVHDNLFSKETHDLWNSMDTKGKAVYVFGWIIVTIIGVVLAWYALIFSVGWFFSQVP